VNVLEVTQLVLALATLISAIATVVQSTRAATTSRQNQQHLKRITSRGGPNGQQGWSESGVDTNLRD
jgi:hypothetical protein